MILVGIIFKKLLKTKNLDGKGAAGGNPLTGDKEATPANWDSYSDLKHNTSVAKEVTNGVRVEDIVEPPTDYHYASFGKSDPFSPPVVVRDAVIAPEAASALEIPLVSPLQRYPLESMQLVGIWQLKSGERKAMVMVREGTGLASVGVIVKTGDLMGSSGGKIIGIGDDFVNVREFTLALDGTRRFEDKQLLLSKRSDDDVATKIRFVPGDAKPQIISERDNAVVPPPLADDEAATKGKPKGKVPRSAAAAAADELGGAAADAAARGLAPPPASPASSSTDVGQPAAVPAAAGAGTQPPVGSSTQPAAGSGAPNAVAPGAATAPAAPGASAAAGATAPASNGAAQQAKLSAPATADPSKK